MAARVPAVRRGPATTATVSTNDASCIAIPHSLHGAPRPAPHFEIRPWQKTARRHLLVARNARKMNPGNRRMTMMRQMPVVMEPQHIDRPGDPEVARAIEDITLGPEVMDVLHSRPRDTE